MGLPPTRAVGKNWRHDFRGRRDEIIGGRGRQVAAHAQGRSVTNLRPGVGSDSHPDVRLCGRGIGKAKEMDAEIRAEIYATTVWVACYVARDAVSS